VHDTASGGRLALPLALLLVVLGWLGPALLPSAGSGDGAHHRLPLLTELADAAPQPPDCDYPGARPAPTSNHEFAAANSDNEWAVCAPRAAARIPAGLWFTSGADNPGLPSTAQSGYHSRAPPSV